MTCSLLLGSITDNIFHPVLCILIVLNLSAINRSYAQRWEMDWQDKQFKKEEAHSIWICLSLKTTLLIDSVSYQY